MLSRILHRTFVTASAAAISLALLPAGFAQTPTVQGNLATSDFGYSYDVTGAPGNSDGSFGENGKWQKFGILSSLALLGYVSTDHGNSNNDSSAITSVTRTSVQRLHGAQVLAGSSAAASLLSGDFAAGAGTSSASETQSAATAGSHRNGLSIFSRPDGTTLFSAGIGMAGVIAAHQGRTPGAASGSSSALTSDRAAGLNTGSQNGLDPLSAANLAPVPEPGVVPFAAAFAAALTGLILVRKNRQRVA